VRSRHGRGLGDLVSITENCPFCGYHTDDVCEDSNDAGEVFYYIFCDHCDASGPCASTPERAERKWNDRNDFMEPSE